MENRTEWTIEKKMVSEDKPDGIHTENGIEQNDGDKIKEDARCEVEISKDQMHASICIIPPKGGRMVDYGDILAELAKAGVIEGINHNKIKEILENGVFYSKVKIAEGKAPVNGQNAQIKYYFDIKKELRPIITEDGKVDFHNLNLVTNVKTGELLAEIIPPAPGFPGKTVTGKILPAKDGKDIHFKPGKNVNISEDGRKIYSNIDGQPVLSEGKISVLQILEIKGDVGPATGNIYFLGSILVRGNVKSGFKIKVEGDAEIEGTVEAAEIEAAGSIIIKRGIQGSGKGYLKAGIDITSRYIENSMIEAGRNIIVYEAAMHSNLSAGKMIKIDGKKGLLVGGSCKAGEELIAKTIGSPMATYTQVEVGINPELKKKLIELNQKLQIIENDLKKALQTVCLFERLKDRDALPPDKLLMYEKLKNTCEMLHEQRTYVINDIEKLEALVADMGRAKVSASNAVMPGVNIAIGNASFKVKDKIEHATFYNYDGQIKFGVYEG
ncbi:MAG: FapA family protein [Tepidanaerobacteraceae bacterium]|jgi:uncharacterized protein (DUF342 family)|nr:FapA family protein [Tepidanaerobacteraceae bacterium]